MHLENIRDYAGTLQYWRDTARGLDSLEELAVAANAAVSSRTRGEAAAAKGLILQRAGELSCRRELAEIIRGLESDQTQAQMAASAVPDDEAPWLSRNGEGRVNRTIGNFHAILMFDPQFQTLRFDTLAGAPVVITQALGEIVSARRWTDADDAAAQQYIEERYGLYDPKKYRKAFLMVMSSRSYHPIREKLAHTQWDGKERMDRFLYNWACCEDTPYTRMVSRLIFAGGIRRLYEPGCKFDYVPVLIGTRQGEGKSTLVRWLALSDAWFGEVTVLDGKEAVEQLSGVWICEMAELLALHRTREQEAVKSFISRQCDRYRRPYAEHLEELPRQCIIIGTTNSRHFLKDKTGNRRFLPVEVHCEGGVLYRYEQACRADILQCWAEARDRYERGELDAVVDPALRDECRQAQDDAMEEDWRVGAIEHYLENKPADSFVCVRELEREALQPDTDYPRELSKKESHELGQIMDQMPGWERAGQIRFRQYGKQRCWKKLQVEHGTTGTKFSEKK